MFILRTAAARVAEARAARGVSASALLPSFGTTDGYTRVRGGIAQGLNRAGVIPGSPAPRSSLLAPFETSIFQLGFDVSWELDFFGGLRQGVDAAAADASVLEAQKSRYELEDELARSKTNVVVNLVALYKALGGGW